MNIFSLILGMIALPTLSFAQEYRFYSNDTVNELQSKEGIRITVKAKHYRHGYYGSTEIHSAEEIQIEVKGAPLTAESRVRAVFASHCHSTLHGWPVEKPTLFADLDADFNAQVEGILITHDAVHGGDSEVCDPTLSIVVDGNWQTDPVNGTHDFKLTNYY